MTARGFRLVALSVVLGGTALLLSGCSWSEALGLGWPNGITPRGQAQQGTVDRLRHRIAGRRRHRVGPDLLDQRVPPQEEDRHRPAASVRLQHAARAGVDRRAVPDHLGALLLHRRGAGEDAAQGSQPRGRHRRHRLPVELEVRLPEDRLQGRHAQLRRRRRRAQERDGVQARGRRRARRRTGRPDQGAQPRGPHLPELRQGRDHGHQQRDPDPGAAQGQAHRVPDRVGRRHPRLLGAGVPLQARRHAGSRRPTTPTTSSRSARSRRPGRSSAAAPRCAAPTTR